MAILTITLHEPIKNRAFWRAFFAEFIGTSMLIFISCGTFVHHNYRPMQDDRDPDSQVAPLGFDIMLTAFATGLCIATLDFILEPTSGAHFNPAISLGMFVMGRVTGIRCLFYQFAQISGGILGAASLWFVMPYNKKQFLGANILWIGLSPLQGFLVEAVCTFLLVLFILCSDDLREKKSPISHHAAIRVGLTYTALTLSMLPYTTVSMNPARSLGPALVSGTWSSHWIYWAGPYIGAGVASLFFAVIWTRKEYHQFYRHVGSHLACHDHTANALENIQLQRLVGHVEDDDTEI